MTLMPCGGGGRVRIASSSRRGKSPAAVAVTLKKLGVKPMGDESSSQAGTDHPTFHDFSEAFDELKRAQIVWEMFGEARHTEVPPAGAWAAKRAL